MLGRGPAVLLPNAVGLGGDLGLGGLGIRCWSLGLCGSIGLCRSLCRGLALHGNPGLRDALRWDLALRRGLALCWDLALRCGLALCRDLALCRSLTFCGGCRVG